jgi:hypothetical protein
VQPRASRGYLQGLSGLVDAVQQALPNTNPRDKVLGIAWVKLANRMVYNKVTRGYFYQQSQLLFSKENTLPNKNEME